MKVAAIGTGKIVETFINSINENDGIECVAIYSRKEDSARYLVDKFNIKKIYTDFDLMLSDENINFIYIALPNSLHFEYALKSLNHGKNVICEKPFTSTVDEIKELIKVAKEKKLFLFEAITNIHLPNLKLIKNEIKRIGSIKFVQCNYSQYSSRYNKLLNGEIPNVFNPKFSGGALADINIYNLHFVMRLFGKPNKVNYFANKHENGIDTSGILILQYKDFICECIGAKDSNSVNFAQIQGEKGFIYVKDGTNGCRAFTTNIQDIEKTYDEQEKNTWYYEINNFANIYKNKDYKSCYELLDYCKSVIEVFVEARKDANIIFESDKK